MSFCVLAGGAVDFSPARDVDDVTAEADEWSVDKGSLEDGPAAAELRQANPRRLHVAML